jgi:secondary thiamine-phosphate synthase enzyme
VQGISISTEERQEVVDITDRVKAVLSKSGVRNGACLVYTGHATCAVTVNENYDPNIGIDLLNCLDELVPQGKWLHDRVDNNGAAHIKASIIGPSEMIPVKDGKLMLGRWQDIILCDFDGPKNRKIVVDVIPNAV